MYLMYRATRSGNGFAFCHYFNIIIVGFFIGSSSARRTVTAKSTYDIVRAYL